MFVGELGADADPAIERSSSSNVRASISARAASSGVACREGGPDWGVDWGRGRRAGHHRLHVACLRRRLGRRERVFHGRGLVADGFFGLANGIMSLKGLLVSVARLLVRIGLAYGILQFPLRLEHLALGDIEDVLRLLCQLPGKFRLFEPGLVASGAGNVLGRLLHVDPDFLLLVAGPLECLVFRGQLLGPFGLLCQFLGPLGDLLGDLGRFLCVAIGQFGGRVRRVERRQFLFLKGPRSPFRLLPVAVLLGPRLAAHAGVLPAHGDCVGRLPAKPVGRRNSQDRG